MNREMSKMLKDIIFDFYKNLPFERFLEKRVSHLSLSKFIHTRGKKNDMYANAHTWYDLESKRVP